MQWECEIKFDVKPFARFVYKIPCLYKMAHKISLLCVRNVVLEVSYLYGYSTELIAENSSSKSNFPFISISYDSSFT